MEQTFQPLLFGGDINVYSVARAFHEAYGVVSICYGIYPSGPAYGSSTCSRASRSGQRKTFSFPGKGWAQ